MTYNFPYTLTLQLHIFIQFARVWDVFQMCTLRVDPERLRDNRLEAERRGFPKKSNWGCHRWN